MFAWLLLYVYVLGDVLDFVIVLRVYVLVDILGFVIVLFQSGVFEHALFCVHVVVVIRVCLGDVLDFVIVLFQSGVFQYILVCSGWGGLACCAYLQNILMDAEKTASGGLKTKLRGTFGNFNVSPRGFCQVWLNAYLSPKINMQQPTLTTMGCNGIIMHLQYRYCS